MSKDQSPWLSLKGAALGFALIAAAAGGVYLAGDDAELPSGNEAGAPQLTLDFHTPELITNFASDPEEVPSAQASPAPPVEQKQPPKVDPLELSPDDPLRNFVQ